MKNHNHARRLLLLASLWTAPFLALGAPDAVRLTTGNYPVATLSGIAAGMTWIGPAVDEPDYYVWCTSPILGNDGKVHLFCSRWPKKYKFDGWSTHCEIAHYVGDR